MSGLECVGKPSDVAHNQVTLEVTSAMIAKPDCGDVLKEKQQFHGRPRRGLHAVSPLVEDSGPVRVEPLFAEPAPENSTSRSLGEAVEDTAVALQDLTTREPVQAPESSSVQSVVTAIPNHGDEGGDGEGLSSSGATGPAPPATDPHPPRGPAADVADRPEEEEDEGHRAPLELMAEFLSSVMKRDFQLAERLCQMILIYEPDHQEAQQFLPLLRERLLTAREEEEESDDDEEDDDEDESDSSEEDDSESTGSDEEAAQSSGDTSSSTLSCSSSSDEGEEEQRMRRPAIPLPSLAKNMSLCFCTQQGY